MDPVDADTADVRAGQVLRGKYRVERVLGRGGMGVVVLATNARTGHRVAIKLLLKRVRARAGVAARFVREARAAARITSEHVAKVLDVDDTADGDPFLVMEYLVGQDLSALVARAGALEPAQAVAYAMEGAEALAEAHALGIVHRDLKPSNLFVANRVPGPGEVVKLLDFGIAKAEDAGDVSLTETDGTVGSPPFMSPEQLLSAKTVDLRTDVWSLGVTLYQLLSATLPFEGTSATGIAARIAATPPRPLAEVAPSVPTDLARIVERCLSKDPDLRYASMSDLASALAPFAGERGDALLADVKRAEERGRAAKAHISVPSQPAAESDTGPRTATAAPRDDRAQEAPARQSAPEPSPPPQAPALPAVATDYTSSEGARSRAPETRRRWGPVAVVGIALAVAAGVAARFAAQRESTHSPPEASDSVPSVASPSLTTHASSSASAIATASASASASAASAARSSNSPRPGVRAKSSAAPRASWSRDPSELELKE